jgi:hypothetical protein
LGREDDISCASQSRILSLSGDIPQIRLDEKTGSLDANNSSQKSS